MLISEIFYSIQGEGELSGVPSVFIRSSGCNLRCSWCDTPYASWQPEGQQMTVAEIVDVCLSYPTQHAVLTGGEPMIMPEREQLASQLREKGFHLTIETAATIPPGRISYDLASLSPKLANSTPQHPKWTQRHQQRRIQKQVIGQWLKQEKYQLKFVVASKDDMAEIEAILADLPTVVPEKIFLMPEGTSHEVLHQRSTWLTEICLTKGYRYGQRLQIELFGNTRGT